MHAPPTFEFEAAHAGPVAGVDEVGRGPLAGPVVAAAVILDPQNIPAGLADSKTLTEKRREALAPIIRQCAEIGVGEASVEEIDALNILQASLLAMRRAVAALPRPPAVCLVDGNQDPALPGPSELIIKGDARSLSIAAASIIAKTVRDEQMRALDKLHPDFGWRSNKGYGSAAHLAALKRIGPTQHHRKSFARIRNMLVRRKFSPRQSALTNLSNFLIF